MASLLTKFILCRILFMISMCEDWISISVRHAMSKNIRGWSQCLGLRRADGGGEGYNSNAFVEWNGLEHSSDSFLVGLWSN